MLLKPEASKLRISLFNIFYATTKTRVFHPPPGLVTVDYDKHISKQQYLVSGFFVAGSRAIRVDMLERLYFIIREHSKDEWTVVQPSMLSITGLGLENFAELIKSLRFEVKHEKVDKSDEVITFEKDGENYKVSFKKHSPNKKVKKIKASDPSKKTRQDINKNKTKNQNKKIDSPFSSLSVLLEN